ncbi:bifunctional phosphopantothenoylcysteine decarboxylase/phosphopantothenate--cysteine ligase CoaBC [Sporomusa acidovorans]|uniref:Coenzyme A biosynthesis bifunctional protein CoaBC n=1 Tax=Sporomusa acidovorans (strain ATCC 49682 / DSM 3132 / Mol) TaxID=1123286 RepID=A0ABZ3J3V8_SPOA4|nr:bifunctional phosphopantothenoylcysteine decarboxylase/phosphopantothenate--cysteine ligase CoaBC [Sporomusa acidovorans]OZC20230.1 coenzyme A biosynthesis bifunctional protein CoaBC [Sporomusa acidovorans DSM 3132]SDD41236.1 phosphopantothenoylcysteine decarboxylase / phosphopantothenate--cysteine ligase [Sporomusa acidovorans]
MSQGLNVVMGVCGGIAVYKAVEIVSRLKKAGCTVHVIMTKSAAEFVTPLTFREISGNPVVTTMWEEPKTWNVQHIALANCANLFLIAPLTANVIGKIANGIADDMLTTTVMATTAPVVLAPAMNTNMFLNPVTQQNLTKLAGLGYHIIEPATGILACGAVGQGRLPEPPVIVDKVLSLLHKRQDLLNKRILITAAGTREPIDPVRYVGNRSSGKMGYALAETAAKRGAEVILVSGPSNLPIPQGVTIKKVETAAQMHAAVLSEFDTVDVVIKAAAVADYRPELIAEQKIKKTGDTLTINLVKNPDILRELGQQKKRQLLVGFAAETEDLITHAREKLTRKNLDMIVANDVTLPGAGFNIDTNIVKIIHKNGTIEELPQLRKQQIAEIILDKICIMLTKSI